MEERELIAKLRSSPTGDKLKSWRCFPEEEIGAYVDGVLSGARRKRVQGHLASCDYCLSRVGLLSRLRGEPEPEVPAELVARARALVPAAGGAKPARRWAPAVTWQWKLAAASVVAVLALGVWVRLSETSSLRSGSSEDLSSAVEQQMNRSQDEPPLPDLLVPEEGSVLSASDLVFRWREVPRSLYYEVSLVNLEGDLVWQARSEATRLALPDDLSLASGARYFVWVQAYLPEGKASRSSARVFEVGGGP